MNNIVDRGRRRITQHLGALSMVRLPRVWHSPLIVSAAVPAHAQTSAALRVVQEQTNIIDVPGIFGFPTLSFPLEKYSENQGQLAAVQFRVESELFARITMRNPRNSQQEALARFSMLISLDSRVDGVVVFNLSTSRQIAERDFTFDNFQTIQTTLNLEFSDLVLFDTDLARFQGGGSVPVEIFFTGGAGLVSERVRSTEIVTGGQIRIKTTYFME